MLTENKLFSQQKDAVRFRDVPSVDSEVMKSDRNGMLDQSTISQPVT